MKTLHISEISASEQFKAQALCLAQDPAFCKTFHNIFADVFVPRDPDWKSCVTGRREHDTRAIFGGSELPAMQDRSLGQPGTDRKAAEFVQSQGGAVIQVLNDRPRNSPEPGGLKPDVVLASPDMAAAYLGAMVSTRRAIKAGMRI
jgi:hypothetical protein